MPEQKAIWGKHSNWLGGKPQPFVFSCGAFNVDDYNWVLQENYVIPMIAFLGIKVLKHWKAEKIKFKVC